MLHGQFLRQIDEEAEKGRWLWLRSMGIKRETESLIMAAQEQAIRINVIKAKIDNTQEESKCTMCGRVDETVNHVLSESSKMVQTRSAERGESQGNCPGTKGPQGARATNVDHGTQMVGLDPVKCLKLLPRDAKPSLRIDVGPCHNESYKPNTTLSTLRGSRKKLCKLFQE